MKRKISELPAPALAGVVKEKTAKAAIAEIKNCMYDGATMIDLHMSCLINRDADALKEIVTSDEKVKALVEGQNVVKIIAVPGRLVNFVVK